MRVNLTLAADDLDALAKVMASMSPKGPDGTLRGIGLQDGIRYALRVAAKVSK